MKLIKCRVGTKAMSLAPVVVLKSGCRNILETAKFCLRSFFSSVLVQFHCGHMVFLQQMPFNKFPSPKLISGDSPIMEADNESEILLKDRLFPILVKEAMSSCECPAGINLNNANLCVCKN